MARSIDLGKHLDTLGHSQLLQLYVFLLGVKRLCVDFIIVVILLSRLRMGRETRKRVALQAMGSLHIFPVLRVS